ncbi:MAG: hypothetical protein KJO49_04720, partial [Bacteroidia bacterium]|nr:hypothetical protein [Bacteroidia bacterium]
MSKLLPISLGHYQSVMRPLLVAFILILITSCKEKAEEIPGLKEPTNITLIIKNATPLFNNPNYNAALIKTNCKMTDDRTNSGMEIDPYDIISIVNIDKDVTWDVQVNGPSSEDYTAKILLIEEKSSSTKNFFGAKILPPNAMGNVKGKANNEAIVGNYYTYSLFFSLTKGDV